MSALITLAVGVLGYWCGRCDGALAEKARITKMLQMASRKADVDLGETFGWSRPSA